MSQSGSFLLLLFIALLFTFLLVMMQLTRLGYLVRTSIPDRPRRRAFLASISFFVSFLSMRLLVYFVVHGDGPFQFVMVGGRHIHHLVWGILILLLVGYGWLMDVGRAHSPTSILLSRIMAIGFGMGAALTLDEFALWLNLDPDAYWLKQGGRVSIDAVVLFGALGRAILPGAAAVVDQGWQPAPAHSPAYAPREVASSAYISAMMAA
jgi:hypothetical protein